MIYNNQDQNTRFRIVLLIIFIKLTFTVKKTNVIVFIFIGLISLPLLFRRSLLGEFLKEFEATGAFHRGIRL